MNSPLLRHPEPDFDAMDRVIRGLEVPRRVHFIELVINDPILQAITERFTDDPWVTPSEDAIEAYWKQVVSIYYRLGYDNVTMFPTFLNLPEFGSRVVKDGAQLPAGDRDRQWVDEAHGLIRSWEDFEHFPWDEIRPDYARIEMIAGLLPDGMKLTVMPTLFTHVHSWLLGNEGLFYMLHDDPELVGAVFDRWGQIIYDLYANVIQMDQVGSLWHADDLGFTTSTLVSPADLRRYVIPWFVRYGELAHSHDKSYWLHCCGNVYATGIIDDLIDPVGLDAFHSFQDPILPAVEFQDRYGDRLAALGGVDVDKLCRLDEGSLREYMREILDKCMPRGRYVFGSGNSVPDFTPLESYICMLEEGRRWSTG